MRTPVLIAGFLAAAAVPLATAGIFDDPKNLKVLPKDIAAQELRRVMRSFSLELGVGCESCHVGEAGQPVDTFDFASDDKAMKATARQMMRMLADINDRQLAELERPREERVAVRCATCHRGLARPLLIGDELALAYGKEGAAGAVARYRALKSDHFGSGSYDFGETPRLLFADAIAATNDFAAAIAFLRDTHDEHGASYRTDLKLADLHFMNEDRANAIASYEAALASAPPAVQQNIRTRLEGLLALPAVPAVAGPPAPGLAAYEPFIGKWSFSDEFLSQNEWANDFYAETLEWGGRKNIVRLRETVHRTDPDRMVFEGFAYWHPTENRLRFTGYNVQERFFFEGAIVELTQDRMVKEYRVHYPPGFAHGVYKDVPGDVREFREERRLIDPDTLELRIWFRIGGEWHPWPDADAKPFVTKRER